MLFTSSLSRILITFFLMLGIPAQAQQPQRANLGTLTCTLDSDAQTPPRGEGRAMRCVFKPTSDGPEHAYSGLIRQVAQGQLPSGKLVMIWAVQGPGGVKLDPAQLQQTYVAAGHAASDAGRTLTGDRNPEITLHAESADAGPSGVLVTVLQLMIMAVPA
jgi:hypothetical protein